VTDAVLSIQSAVAYGHVGNSAATFPLQRLGLEVWPVPTVLLSNHTGYPTWHGRALVPAEVAALLRGIEERGAFTRTRAVLTGYLGDPALGDLILRTVARVRAAQAHAVWLCDPVMGDEHGLFVRPGIPELYRDRLLPAADILTPNPFELAYLAGTPVPDLAAARAAAAALRARGPRTVVATGLRFPDHPGRLTTLADTETGTWVVHTPRIDHPVSGTGDAFAALFLAWWLRTADLATTLSHATSATHALVATTAATGAGELAIVAAQASFATPPRLFAAEQLA
jgi:pyridoxine kinase